MSSDQPQNHATFSHMRDGTSEDWAAIAREFAPYARQLPDRVLDHLTLLKGDCGGFPIDRLSHCLQTATLGSYNHADIAAAILKPFVSEENHWMVAHHGIFQGYYFFHHLGMDRDLRDQFQHQAELYRYTAEFCERYDAAAFDPQRETLPLAFFEPMLPRVLAVPKQSLYAKIVARESVPES